MGFRKSIHWKQKIDILHLQQTPLLDFPQLAPLHRPTWSVAVVSSQIAEAAATGAGTMATWAPLLRHLSPRWTAAPTKACTWSWTRETSSVPKSQKYMNASFYWCVLSLSDLTSVLLHLRGVPSLPQSSFRGVYKCLWPNCGKVLTSSVGIKRHIRVLHLGWVGFVLDLIHRMLFSPSYVTFLCIWKSIRATNEKKN